MAFGGLAAVASYCACHKNDVFVTLSGIEIDEAMEVGRKIYQSSQERGLRDYRKFKGNGWVDPDGERLQALGSVAERAAAKALGLEWTAWYDTFKRPDLHHNIEVRMMGVNRYGLRVYDRDHDSKRVVGIVIERGREAGPYRIPGWINAVHGKRPEYLMDPLGRGQPVFAVPQYRLHHLSVLMDLIEAEQRNEVLS